MVTRHGPWVAWALGLWAVLKVNELPLLSVHGICGPWGCGPPLQAVLACHGAWLMMLIPTASVALTTLSARQRRQLGLAAMGASAVSVLGMGIFEYLTWMQQVDPATRAFFLNRWMFSIIVLTDVPLLQVGVLGGVLWWLGHEPPEFDDPDPIPEGAAPGDDQACE